jgi:hypothetical protein
MSSITKKMLQAPRTASIDTEFVGAAVGEVPLVDEPFVAGAGAGAGAEPLADTGAGAGAGATAGAGAGAGAGSELLLLSATWPMQSTMSDIKRKRRAMMVSGTES